MLYTIHGIAQNDSYVSIRKVVIDAGHGGKDPGAVSINRKTQEKNITLTVALKLGDLIKKNFPDIKVIYTRSTDVFIPLNQRTDIANKNRADLFISVHVNSAKARSAAGTETFVMGMDKSSSNLEVSKLENSVVVLEGDDFSSKYEGFDPNVPESYIIFSLLQNSHLEHSLSFASLVQRNLSKGPIIINRGIKQAGLLVLW
ncbi:MAG TPA: N-acetylmuramoyl-L-alanine amidase, partial [Bacteroidales bacterium]|nr:N-acetylmuramoyl-L-alanine amidase [Bacteroidales bacterium]